VATEGVTPLFFPEKPGDLFLLIAVTITIAFYYCFHSGVTPSRVGCHLFYLSDLVSPLFFVNLPTKFFSLGCHPLEGVTRGGLPPSHPLVTPLVRSVSCSNRSSHSPNPAGFHIISMDLYMLVYRGPHHQPADDTRLFIIVDAVNAQRPCWHLSLA